MKDWPENSKSAHAKATSTEELPAETAEDIESLDELADEWTEDDGETSGESKAPRYTPQQLTEMQRELAQLREFHQLARSIMRNSKGEVLLTALRRGFDAAAKAKADATGAAALQQKAIIFTESRKTQEYLLRILEQTEFKGRITIFNGTNSDPASKAIYQRWLERHRGTDKVSGSPTADMRAALVEHFRDESSILIATEAAAEGINLQFCNVVVNYDLPWKPQRIEQRIGRCHRYNKSNAADQRVYQLLDEKFRLFNGVFGASEETDGLRKEVGVGERARQGVTGAARGRPPGWRSGGTARAPAVRVTPLAEGDIARAQEDYEGREFWLGNGFVEQVRTTLTRIGQNPFQFMYAPHY